MEDNHTLKVKSPLLLSLGVAVVLALGIRLFTSLSTSEDSPTPPASTDPKTIQLRADLAYGRAYETWARRVVEAKMDYATHKFPDANAVLSQRIEAIWQDHLNYHPPVVSERFASLDATLTQSLSGMKDALHAATTGTGTNATIQDFTASDNLFMQTQRDYGVLNSQVIQEAAAAHLVRF